MANTNQNYGMGTEGLQDPLQGYDIKVVTRSMTSNDFILVGAFTSLMFKIINQVETYLPVNSRIPRMFDSEVIVVWSLEQGLVEMNVVKNTFGPEFASGFSKGRLQKIPRSLRFNIQFIANAMIDTASSGEQAFSVGLKNGGSTPGLITPDVALSQSLGYQINQCRVDIFSFGVSSGKHVVANTWQGTGQHVSPLSK